MEINIKNLCKSYGKHEVLRNVCLTIPVGMYGLLGKNGAGKTTLMRILATVSEQTSGSVAINEMDIKEKKKIRKIIGYLPQEFSIYPAMTVYSALDYLAVLSEIPKSVRKPRINLLLRRVNLEQEKTKKFRDLSGGMKRRFGIAQALLNDPQILIVDEPTAGLDPEERIRFNNLLSELAGERIVLLSTHIASDIESTCSHAAILDHGTVIYHGSIADILEIAKGKVYSAPISQSELTAFKKKYNVIHIQQNSAGAVCRFLSETPPHFPCKSCESTVEDSYMYMIDHQSKEDDCDALL
jgi:ABC-2 type transport system ATP-binding protein